MHLSVAISAERITPHELGQVLRRLRTGQTIRPIDIVVVCKHSEEQEFIRVALDGRAKLVPIHADDFSAPHAINLGLLQAEQSVVVVLTPTSAEFRLSESWLADITELFGNPDIDLAFPESMTDPCTVVARKPLSMQLRPYEDEPLTVWATRARDFGHVIFDNRVATAALIPA